MSAVDVSLLAGVLLVWAVISRRMSGGWLSGPMFFVAVGVLMSDEVFGWFELDGIEGSVRLLAEVTLALVLFTDASNLDLTALRREYRFPARLLGIGLPLTIVLGGLLAAVVLTELSMAQAFVLAILLAPTDAALGQAVVSDERLPTRVRQGLNVESGLNDGICVPLLFAALALVEAEAAPGFAWEVIRDMFVELGIAITLGALVAAIVAIIRNRAATAGWIDHDWARIIPLATVGTAYALTLEAGGSGFIASFVAGLVYGLMVRTESERATEFAEEAGDVLSAVTFVVFAVVLAAPTFADLTWRAVVYALLSLTVVRMIPVALCLLGAARPATMAFAGWFGPRGLASIVFALVVVEESGIPGTDLIVQVATVTVVVSVLLHGVTASPLTARYAAWCASHPRDIPEVT